MTDRLAFQYQALAELLSGLSQDRQVEVALAIAEVAVRSSGTFLANRDPVALAERVEFLDEVAWDLQEEAPERYPAAFRQARAANAVLCAVQEAPAEAIYEALAALDDESIVDAILQRG